MCFCNETLLHASFRSDYVEVANTLWLGQDSYAIRSYNCGIAAQKSGAFSWEITPVRFASIFYVHNEPAKFQVRY